MSKQFTVPIILPADPATALEAATKQYVDAKTAAAGAATSLPTIRLYLSANQSIAAGSTDVLAWTEATDSDPQGYFTMINPSRVRVNQAGTYIISYIHRWSAILGATAVGQSECKMNAGELIANGTRLFLGSTIVSNTSTGAKMGSTTKMVRLAQYDYLNFFVSHSDNVARQVDTGEAATSLQISALIGPQGPQGVPGSGSTVSAQEEGTLVGTRPTFNFIGPNVTATDDAANSRVNVTTPVDIVNFKGAWAAQAYLYADVVQQFGSYWIWQSGTPSLSTDSPGVGSNSWWQLSGVAIMTTAEITAWTGAHTGNVVWNSTTGVKAVRASSVWQEINPIPILTQAALGTVAAATNDQTVRTLYTTAALPSAGLLSVTINCYVQQTGTGVCEYYLIAEIIRGGSSIGSISGQNARQTMWATAPMQMKINFQWVDARAGDTVRVNFNRITAANTFQVGLSGVNNHGISWTLQPYA